MRRKYAQPALPTLYFKDGILSVPGYAFEKAVPWEDTGSMTLLAEGANLQDGTSVLAKIVPAHSNASLFLEREAHILERMATSPESSSTILQMIDFFTIPKTNGDCVVLLLFHPGLNVLGRYFPPAKVNDLLLGDISRAGPASGNRDILMTGVEEPYAMEEMEAIEIMDLATFLEFAIQATHCLEMVHRNNIVHREVRANAFHLNHHSGLVRLVHFGNRAVSLEEYGVPSEYVLQADQLDEDNKFKVKEALSYFAPEQTGSMENLPEDHRTDLYSLGIMFWTLLVGRGTLPFESGPLDLLYAVVHKRPMPVHEIRRDIPQVLAIIIEKLLYKSPDARYQSAYGLKQDLLECQRRLLAAVALSSDGPTELIPSFEIATGDRCMDFTIPGLLFGRDKELETIRNIVRHTSTSYSRQIATSRGPYVVSSSNSGGTSNVTTGEERSDSMSSKSEASGQMAQSPDSPGSKFSTVDQFQSSAASGTSGPSTVTAGSMTASDGLRRVALAPSHSRARTHAAIILGPPGAGKSSLILAQQAKWRAHGLWGQAKFTEVETGPFASLLACLSHVLRQLIVFNSDLHRFVNDLKQRLGPQLQNVPLLYEGAPELKTIFSIFGLTIDLPQETLETSELPARFQSLVENVFAVLAETRLFALFLDDLHEASDSSLELINALVNSRTRLLIFGTVRSDKQERVDRIRQTFATKASTWITLEPLSYPSVSTLVARTLHRPKEDVAHLARIVHGTSEGNAFAARNLLTTLYRQKHIWYDWDRNYWQFNIAEIEKNLLDKKVSTEPGNLAFLVDHLRQLPEDARKFIMWASFFGPTFKVTEVALLMDWDDSEESNSSGTEDDIKDMWNISKAVSILKESTTRRSVRGLQTAITEGWLVQRARDMCTFAHDRYRQAAQAEAENQSEESTAKMSFRIILMMLHDADDDAPDIYRVAEHAKRCLPLLREFAKRDELLEMSLNAGDSARARGAHELALQSYMNARSLLDEDSWKTDVARTSSLFMRLAEMYTWKAEFNISDNLLQECLLRCEHPEDKARILRLRSRNHWMRGNYGAALNDNTLGLHLLGVDVNTAPSRREADIMFELVKNEILAVGFDDILNIPRARDSRTDLAIGLLNDAGTNAYWSPGEGFADVIGLTTVQLALRAGMCPGTALGFFWALGAAAERRELFRFSTDLGKLALRIADQYGTSFEKCRALVLYVSMVSGFDNVHIRANIPRLEEAIKYGQGAGDRVFTSFSSVHLVLTRLYIGDHLSEVVVAGEESLTDVQLWTSSLGVSMLAQGTLNCIRALGGYTVAHSAETAFDTDTFIESEYLQENASFEHVKVVMNWYNSFKLVGLFCLGFVEEAAALGFYVWDTRDSNPNHRHIRYALFFHCLALIHRIRNGGLPVEERAHCFKQVEANQSYIRKWLSPSPVNTSAWVALIDAEIASLTNNPDAFKLYDVAVKLAMTNDWMLEGGYGLYLQGSHFVRCGVENLGGELQRRGIARQAQWGARGVVNHLSSLLETRSQPAPLKRQIFTSDVAVQTDSVIVTQQSFTSPLDRTSLDATEEEQISTLTAADLASILKWSKEISGDINLSMALQRLTEIATEISVSQNTCVVIAREAGDYTVATSMNSPEACKVHENPISIRSIVDPLRRTVIQHALNNKERVYYEDIMTEPRFANEAAQSPHRSVICIPIFSNRGQTFGAVYLASKYAFSPNIVTMLTLLCQQASIGISNALLFRSVQAGTKENLKMISAQRDALEAARKSRGDALKATKIKSNFLASMSHELRTPFSSFYGLLDILSGTELNAGQREIVQTAKQSCELLLRIIDSILDYSKLEADAVKLEYSGFSVENLLADCMELLLPMAARKLDLSFNIEPDVPPWVKSDYARIRQVLMNLIGNAVKFTANGFVRLTCAVDPNVARTSTEISLRFSIQDTGIGLSRTDVDQLFVPFQQADNSSTRRFGGTGLGLSISRQLVKLMGGVIGVESELNAGSTFWFTLPVKIFESEESRQTLAEVERLRSFLTNPQPLRILVGSASTTTQAMLSTMLSGFSVTPISSINEVEPLLHSAEFLSQPLDFVILDDQSESRADDLTRFIRSLSHTALQDTKVVHFFTPTTDNLAGAPMLRDDTASPPGIVRMTKPPRQLKLLQVLASLKNVLDHIPLRPIIDSAVLREEHALAQRTLYGNVLVAEDNPVAQKLLIKQLERYDINVIATSNGEEAIAEWESHEPGYFTAALFDHHMPILDGVEACKRLRIVEGKRKVPFVLPIVALSADCQESTKQLCLSAGMNGFFSKPLKKNDLLSLLGMFAPASSQRPSPSPTSP
ncbi:histidine kinase [Epithele typhae]|uniref:histidine kinase n=1 Tax=Epithele typhae TaxID=378194 RepID=UPI002008B981|nr:histidine kinase [Epithele typhae]KAH9927462.1 histidine kinase [Epithele typhae]